MADEESGKINVYVANLGAYNEGVLRGGWISLPVPDAELDRFMRETVGVAPRTGYEEYAIHDYERNGLVSSFDMPIGEYSSLSDLNLLAQVVGKRSDEDPFVTGNPIALANFAMQSDEIPFHEYEVSDEYAADSLEERYALGLVESGAAPEVKAILDGQYGPYFDLERWGRDASMDVTLCEDGYYDNAEESPDEHLYSREELREYVAEADAVEPPRAFDLASLVEDGETIADYQLAGDATNAGAIRYQCIIPRDSTDISAALEDTLNRIIADRADAGASDTDEVVRETMGAERYDDAATVESGSVIDRGYMLPGAIVSFDKRDASTSGMDPADPMNIAMSGMDASGLTM